MHMRSSLGIFFLFVDFALYYNGLSLHLNCHILNGIFCYFSLLLSCINISKQFLTQNDWYSIDWSKGLTCFASLSIRLYKMNQSTANVIPVRQHLYIQIGPRYEFLVPWWHHQMEIFSALLAICAGNSPVPVNSLHKGQWPGALMFSSICTWINGWVNNREAGDLRLYRAHYDVVVMHLGLHGAI